MSARPLVTIGVPAYNSAAHIREALVSALAQRYEPLEIIVVDDASTDDTVDIVRSLDDPRLRVVINDTNLGLAGNHDRVIELARGEYVKILHADDLLAPDAIERQAAALADNPGVSLVTSKRVIIDDDGKRIMGRGARWEEGVRGGTAVMHELVRSGRNLLGEPSAQLFRRSIALEVGGYSAEWPYVVDLEFCVRLLARGDLYYVPAELASFRVTPGQQSARLAGVQADDVERLLREVQRDHAREIGEAEIERGIRTARRDARMRRVLYSVLSVPAGHRERIAYLFAGGWNTAFSYAVFALLWLLFGEVWPSWLILASTTVVGALNAFVVQRQVVFRSQGRVVGELGRFSFVYAIIGALNIVAFPALVDGLRLNPYLSQAAFTVFVIVAGYIANKYFSFRDSEK